MTIGEGEIAEHLTCGSWGWNARKFSSEYLAIEFAQAHENDAITDAQVRAFAWWFLNMARARWPSLPTTFPTHAELDKTLVVPDGKTDCFIDGTAIRARITALL